MVENRDEVFLENIYEEEANFYVKEELEALIGHDVLAIQRYITDEKNFFAYHVYYEKNYRDSMTKVLLPLNSDHYFELLRRGLLANGYVLKKLKRKYDEKENTIFYCISYYDKKEKEETKSL